MNQQDKSVRAREEGSSAVATCHKSDFHSILKKKYRITGVLGEGSNGTVYKGKDRVTQQKVALKLISYKADSFYKCKQLLREVAIHRHLSQQQAAGDAFVPRLLDVEFSEGPCDDSGENELCLVMELVPGRTLDDFLKQALLKKITLGPKEAKALITNMTKAVEFMHKAGVIHRDIKPANLMVTPDLRVTLLDFGLARTLVCDIMSQAEHIPKSTEQRKSIGRILDTERITRKHCKRSLSPHVCSRVYRSPEIALTEHYSYSADIWSIGCVAAEILSCQAMYDFDQKASRFLFTSFSSYPMSPNKERARAEKTEDRLAEDDLLRSILTILGDLEDTDLSFITRSSRRKVVRSCFSANNAIQFGQEYPGTAKELVAFLEKTLQFNPYFRLSASQLLSVLASLPTDKDEKDSSNPRPRASSKESSAVERLSLEVDSPDAYDYTLLKPKKHCLADIQRLMKEEQQQLRC